MSTIVRLEKELYLSYTWSNNNHGICGHTFEVIDYFYVLKKYFDVGILLCEDIDWPTLEKAIRYKYDFTEEEIKEIRMLRSLLIDQEWSQEIKLFLLMVGLSTLVVCLFSLIEYTIWHVAIGK